MSSRRGFLASLAGAAAIALDPERALWVPGKKLISIPAPRPRERPLALGDLLFINGIVHVVADLEPTSEFIENRATVFPAIATTLYPETRVGSRFALRARRDYERLFPEAKNSVTVWSGRGIMLPSRILG